MRWSEEAPLSRAAVKGLPPFLTVGGCQLSSPTLLSAPLDPRQAKLVGELPPLALVGSSNYTSPSPHS